MPLSRRNRTSFYIFTKELEDDINSKMQQTQEALLEHFDEDIHDLLKIKLDQAKERLDKVSRWFWDVTLYQLNNHAIFNEQDYSFTLIDKIADFSQGKYQLIRKGKQVDDEAAQVIDKQAHKYRITHPLGEHVIESSRKLTTPQKEVVFDYQGHKTKVSVAEQLQEQSGWISLNLLRIEAFQTEEHLVFTGMTDKGQPIDGEACKKLFNVGSKSIDEVNATVPERLLENQSRQLDAKLAEAMDFNNKYFQDERDKLEKWADDKILAAEQALVDTKNQIRSLKRESRHAVSVEEQQQMQKQLKDLERKQRKQRAEIWDVEDEIADKRDELIAALEARMKQKTEVEELFTIRWSVV